MRPKSFPGLTESFSLYLFSTFCVESLRKSFSLRDRRCLYALDVLDWNSYLSCFLFYRKFFPFLECHMTYDDLTLFGRRRLIDLGLGRFPAEQRHRRAASERLRRKRKRKRRAIFEPPTPTQERFSPRGRPYAGQAAATGSSRGHHRPLKKVFVYFSTCTYCLPEIHVIERVKKHFLRALLS